MRLTINGEQVELEKGLTISRLLKERDVKMPDMVSVELNGTILKRDAFDEIMVQDGDTVEFLYFMGGGA